MEEPKSVEVADDFEGCLNLLLRACTRLAYGLNTILVVLSLKHVLALRKVWAEDCGTPPEFEDDISWDRRIVQSGIRASAMLLPLLAISWFLGVVALENSTSIFFQLAASFANIALSWLVLYFLGEDILPSCTSFGKLEDAAGLPSALYFEDIYGISVQPSAAQLSFDNEPLLTEDCCSGPSGPSTSAAPGGSSAFEPASASAAPSTSTGAFGKLGRRINLTGKGSPLPSPADEGGVRKMANNNNVNNSSSCSVVVVAGGKFKGHKSNKSGGKLAAANSSISTTSFTSLAAAERPNWSQPGGNEIYELRHDAISTIYK